MMFFPSPKSLKNNGAALLIVLAFVVLLTGLVLAYFSRTTTDRQLAHSSFNDTDAALLARSALDIVVGDFKQEIVSGSSATMFPAIPYFPSPSPNVVPQRSPTPAVGTTPVIPNLIRRSVYPDLILTPPAGPAVASRASNINSTVASANGRSLSLARWNKHYLVPKLNTGDDSTDPITGAPLFTAPNYWAPDWVIVTRAGPTPIAAWDATLKDATVTNTNYAVGRYAYAVYDEGGLLDANVVGLPLPAPPVSTVGRKGTAAMADLTAIKMTPGGATPNPATISRIVGWRNFISARSAGTFPTLVPNATSFANYYLDTARDFLRPMETPTQSLPAPTPVVAPVAAATASPLQANNRTDQYFVTRAQLVKLVSDIGGSSNMLQFLGTFSRAKNYSTWRAQGGSSSNKAETVIGGRYWLENLAMVIPNPANGQPTQNIRKSFGLMWVAGGGTTPGYWRYVGFNGNVTNTTALDHIPFFVLTRGEFMQTLNYALHKDWDTDLDDPVNIASTLTIAAALIDQYDNDTVTDPTTGSTTTRIDYAGGTVYGMEKNDPNRPQWAPTPPAGFVPLNRPFRNVGELGYAFNQASVFPDNGLDFASTGSDGTGSRDAPVLDLFTYNTATPFSLPLNSSGEQRAGIVSLNTQNVGVIAALLKSAVSTEPSTTVDSTAANDAAAAIVADATNGTSVKPAVTRRDVARLAAAAGTTIGTTPENKKTVARVLAEVGDTRTWGLLIDIVAQTGHYPPNAESGPNTTNPLANFVVEGEKHYWLHVAIDRFDGNIVGQQLEEVTE